MSRSWLSLSPSGQKDEQGISSLREVHPVAGSVVDANLRYSLAHRPHVPGVAQGHPPDAVVDSHPGLPVPKPPEPTCVNISLANLKHHHTVGYRILGAQGVRADSGGVNKRNRPMAISSGRSPLRSSPANWGTSLRGGPLIRDNENCCSRQ